jgi:hypothetical protein
MTIWQAGMTSTELAAAIIEEAGGDIEFVSEAELAEALAAYAPKASPTFTGDVKIPDGNADGEALAYLQAGARLQNLRFDSAEPYLDFNETDQAVDLRRWRVQAFNGDLYVQPVTDGAIPTTTPIRVNRNGAVSFAGAPAVTVPVPTASGHALRQGSDATVGALTATGTVSVLNANARLSIGGTATPGVEYLDSEVAGKRRFLEFLASGQIKTRLYQSNGVTVDQETIWDASGLNHSNLTSVRVPAATATTHAAQVSAIDAATGKYEIGGKRGLNDTGWRDISASLPWAAAFSTSSAWIYRSGNSVEMQFTLARTDGLTTAINMFDGTLDFDSAIPDGFRPRNLSAIGIWSAISSGDIPAGVKHSYYHMSDSAAAWVAVPVAGTVRGKIEWKTINAHPTVLPGTAA